MSHWDFGRPTGGHHDTRDPADADNPPNLTGGADDEAWPAQGLRPADLGWPVQDAWPDDGGPAEDPWAANRGRPARERWSPGMPEPPGEGENWADNYGDGDGTAP